MAATLLDLERLQKKADRLNAERNIETKLQMEIATLRNKVQKLRKRKAELLVKVKEPPSHILQQCIDFTNSSQPGLKTNFGENADYVETIAKTLQVLKQRQLMEVCDAYRLTGISIMSQEANKVCFRCETFCNGEYFEPYYIEILKGAELTIGRNTIPYFIPLQTIVEANLNSDLKQFFITLGQYLSAFVSRREQVRLLSKQYQVMLSDNIYTSPAYDFVQFIVKNSNAGDTEVKLMYDNFLHKLPSDVTIKVKCKGKSSSGTKKRLSLHQKEKLFKQLALPEAFSQAFT